MGPAGVKIVFAIGKGLAVPGGAGGVWGLGSGRHGPDAAIERALPARSRRWPAHRGWGGAGGDSSVSAHADFTPAGCDLSRNIADAGGECADSAALRRTSPAAARRCPMSVA
jgi:hypothetical protein